MGREEREQWGGEVLKLHQSLGFNNKLMFDKGLPTLNGLNTSLDALQKENSAFCMQFVFCVVWGTPCCC